MEFWGVEVKPGETVKCDPEADKYLHISQASLGVTKKDKGNESVLITVKVDGKDLIIGTLSAKNCSQIQYDLVFEKEFELSHNWKDGSVFFVGYKTIAADVDPNVFSDDEFDSECEEDVQLAKKANGNAKKLIPLKAKESVKGGEDIDDDEDDESDDDDDSEDDDSDEEMVDGEDDSDDEDGSSEEEEDATPKKVENGKRRPVESVPKTPVSQKKAKLDASASKAGASDVKKGGHTATPHPAKQVGKSNDKSKPQTPKTAGSASCKSCSKTFNSDSALQAHTKAKHGGN